MKKIRKDKHFIWNIQGNILVRKDFWPVTVEKSNCWWNVISFDLNNPILNDTMELFLRIYNVMWFFNICSCGILGTDEGSHSQGSLDVNQPNKTSINIVMIVEKATIYYW